VQIFKTQYPPCPGKYNAWMKIIALNYQIDQLISSTNQAL